MNARTGVVAFGARPLLVTGASGFIGTAVVRELVAGGGGAGVRVLARRPVPRWMADAGVVEVRGDLADAASLAGACVGVGTVLHLASQIGGDPGTCRAVNEGGTRALLAEARRAGALRIAYLSTCGVYGEGEHRGQSESELVAAPVSATSRTRLAAERMVLAEGGVVLRPNLVYGDGDRHVVPTLVRWLRSVPAWAYGGSARMSVIAVPDIAAAIAAVATLPWTPTENGEIFHVTSPAPILARDLITSVCELLDLPLPDDDLPVQEHRDRTRAAMPELTDHQFSLLAQDHWYDSSRIWGFTGVSPAQTLQDRMPAAADWYRSLLVDQT